MRDLKTLKLTVGIAPRRDLEPAALERLGTLAFDLSQVFHGATSCGWKRDASPVLALRALLRAAAFESFRTHWDWWVLSTDEETISLRRIAALVERADADGVDAVASGGGAGGRGFDLAIVRSHCVRALLDAGPADDAFGALDEERPDAAFLARLAGLGFKVDRDDAASTLADPDRSPLQPARLPLDVHFFPSMQTGTRDVASLSEIATPLRVAVRVLRTLAGGGRIAVYGAGQIAEEIVPLLGDRVAFALDRNTELHKKPFHGVDVLAPEAVVDRVDEIEAVLITALGREPEVTTTLLDLLGDRARDVRILSLDGAQAGAHAPADEATRVRFTSAEEAEAIAEGDAFQPARLDPSLVPEARPDTTTERTITKRAVLYTGFPCNIRCIFCYYTYVMDGAKWNPLEQCIADADLYRHHYGNDAVDITGGEPTAYPHIAALVEHCATIGLRPTLITNMRMLAKLEHAQKLKDAGAYDFLCSVHALGRAYDFIAQTRNGWEKLTRGLTNINRLGMPWRTNCTLTLRNMRQLRKIAEFAFLNGSRAINFINYNPFYEWQTKMDIDFQARHTEVAPHLVEALDYCDEVGLEANVRYFPLCMMKGHEDKAYNYGQLSYDHHEWDYNSWYSDRVNNPSAKYPAWLPGLECDEHALHEFQARRTREDSYAACTSCSTCAVRSVCDGFTKQYAERFGTAEATPYAGESVSEITHFIRGQRKVVDR
ncbi:MAG: radical SAM protein [Myxococcales bacterium]|nr:radical SAM protein [Myxococcales bacterium]